MRGGEGEPPTCITPAPCQGKWSFLSLVVAMAVAAAAVVVVAPPSVIVSIIPGSCLTRAIPPSLHQSPASLQLRGSLSLCCCCRRPLLCSIERDGPHDPYVRCKVPEARTLMVHVEPHRASDQVPGPGRGRRVRCCRSFCSHPPPSRIVRFPPRLRWLTCLRRPWRGWQRRGRQRGLDPQGRTRSPPPTAAPPPPPSHATTPPSATARPSEAKAGSWSASFSVVG